MNYILDKHTLIWFLNADDNLSAKVENTIEGINNINYFSIVSLWEISIKMSLDKLKLNFHFENIKKKMDKNNFQQLPITFEDTLILSSLPLFHRVPFDRLLISQAISNVFTLISKDSYFEDYDVKLL